jgi:hypothetical protein
MARGEFIAHAFAWFDAAILPASHPLERFPCRHSNWIRDSPAGDQPEAIRQMVEGMEAGLSHQTLLGVTGSGKTFSIANVIARVQRPTMVLAPNKTLAAQLYGEFKAFFPNNAVEYFVSYYDYYQPEAYVPSSDTFIEKDLDQRPHRADAPVGDQGAAGARGRDHRHHGVVHLRPRRPGNLFEDGPAPGSRRPLDQRELLRA